MRNDIVFRAYVTNLGMYNEGHLVGMWVDFPIAHDADTDVKEAVNEVLCDIRVDGMFYEEYFITDYESDIEGLADCFGEYEDLLLLHYLACKIQEMDDVEQFESMIAYGEMTGNATELINLTDNAECFYFMSHVLNDYDLGYEYAESSGLFTEALKSLGTLANYIDYEGYGRDIRLDEGGIHTKNGYISLTDPIRCCFDSSKDEIPDEYLQ
uniref:antirestriction protein ArdA n=1 Tax=Agathobacter sp. TaxID=2021311 RepID=UPI004057195B